MPPRTRKRSVCVDCGAKLKNADGTGTGRIRKPGPRCATCHSANRRKKSDARKAAHVEKFYSISEEQYQKLLKAQGGVCFICGRPPGKRFRLAVDHDHACCDSEYSCGKCVRGLLHRKPCNTFLGWIRDEPEAMDRGAAYLRNPPAREVLGLWLPV